MRWLGPVAVALAALAGGPGSARAEGPAARAAVQAAVAELEAAEAELRSVDQRQAALEAEILRLKQQGDRSVRLEARLQASVAAEAALERALEQVDQARAALEATANRQVRALDQALRRRAADLEVGSRADRRAAALAIQALLDTRAWVVEAARRAEPPALARSRGAELPRVEPLDGPEELREKADFAEDARDKLRAKRAQLAGLLATRQRQRALVRAARDFAVDVSLFDEELRSAAVGRAAGRAAGEDQGTAGEGAANGNPPVLDSSDRVGGAGGNGAATDGAGVGGDGFSESPQPVDPSSPGRQPPSGDDSFTPGGPTSPADPGAPAGSDVSGRSVDPVVLLSLKIDELAGEDVDVKELERLLDEYERVEALFSARARAMRARARRLDEAPPDE